MAVLSLSSSPRSSASRFTSPSSLWDLTNSVRSTESGISPENVWTEEDSCSSSKLTQNLQQTSTSVCEYLEVVTYRKFTPSVKQLPSQLYVSTSKSGSTPALTHTGRLLPKIHRRIHEESVEAGIGAVRQDITGGRQQTV